MLYLSYLLLFDMAKVLLIEWAVKDKKSFTTFAKYIRILVIDMISLILLACILLPQICYICTDKSEYICTHYFSYKQTICTK